MPKTRRTSAEDIAAFYEKLRAGTPEERLQATAKYYGKSVAAIQNKLKFWWPGSRYLKEFTDKRADGHRRWDMPTEKLVKALNEHHSVSQTAKAVKTTPITLAKAIERKGITQVWIVQK